MDTFQQIVKTIESEQDANIRRTQKVTLYSTLKYLQAGRTGISKFDMDNFLTGNRFLPIFQELLHHSIVIQNANSNYILNDNVKDLLPSFLQELDQQRQTFSGL